MSQQTADQATASTSANRLRPEIARIIDSGRQAEASGLSILPVFACAMFTCVLLWFSFAPFEWGFLAWFALIPLLQLVRVTLLPRRAYAAVTGVAFLWALATLQWMRLGHWTMYTALVALSFYVSLYFPVFLSVTRVIRRTRIPLWLAAPLTWTALEYLRAYLLTGFSWYYLGHSQFQWTSLVQISDICGAYGVSFLIVTASAALADCVPAGWLLRLKLVGSVDHVQSPPAAVRMSGLAISIIAIAAACGYGMVTQTDPAAATDGPVIALIQGNFTPEVKHDPDQLYRMIREHDLLTRRAAGLRPELVVWPETMFPVPDQIIGEGVTDEDLLAMMQMPGSSSDSEHAQLLLDRWKSNYARELLVNRSQEAGAAMLVGIATELAAKDGRRIFNSAALIRPDLGYVARYDKIHRVIFGEYIPLKSVLPWLSKLTPYGTGFGIDAGERPVILEYAGTRYSPIICFEDTVPQVVRRAVLATDESGQHPDVLVNLTNDGWFRGSSELDQHLITATFRCIETRRPMVRAVNGGISAFIDSSGRIRQPQYQMIMEEESAGVVADFHNADSMVDPATGRRYRQCSAVLCGQLPLDGRTSIYLRFGDWFAVTCLALTCLGFAWGRRSS